MRKILALGLLLLTIVIAGGCSSSGITSSVTQNPSQTTSTEQIITNISATETYALIQENAANPDFVVIDVRTVEEYSQGHLGNAVLIDYRLETFRDEISKLDRKKKYLIYCRTGNRSSGARDKMKELGFMHIYHMEDGITEWNAQGLPVVY